MGLESPEMNTLKRDFFNDFVNS